MLDHVPDLDPENNGLSGVRAAGSAIVHARGLIFAAAVLPGDLSGQVGWNPPLPSGRLKEEAAVQRPLSRKVQNQGQGPRFKVQVLVRWSKVQVKVQGPVLPIIGLVRLAIGN